MKKLFLISYLIFFFNFSYAQLNAEFTWCPEPDSSGQICCIRFLNLSTDTGGTITSYFYTFGDGQESTLMEPRHCYVMIGTYIVTLFVTDNLGNIDTAIHNLTITHIDTAGCNCDSLIDISEYDPGKYDFSISPNPVQDHADLTWTINNTASPKSMTAEMTIYNATGKPVRTDLIQLEDRKYKFKRKDLPAGIYFFKIFTEDNIQCGRGKFIIE